MFLHSLGLVAEQPFGSGASNLQSVLADKYNWERPKEGAILGASKSPITRSLRSQIFSDRWQAFVTNTLLGNILIGSAIKVRTSHFSTAFVV